MNGKVYKSLRITDIWIKWCYWEKGKLFFPTISHLFLWIEITSCKVHPDLCKVTQLVVASLNPVYRICHLNNLTHLRDVVHTRDICTPCHARRHCCSSSPDPLARLLNTRDAPDKPLPTRPHEPGKVVQPLDAGPQSLHLPEQREVLGLRLGEPDPGVEDDAPAADAGRLGDADARAELRPHALDHALGVVGELGHCRRVAAHVHQDDRLAGARHRREHLRVERAGGDVVDDVRAGGARLGRHARAVGVDADGDVDGLGDGGADVSDRGDDAGEFLLFANGGCVGTGALAADVDDCRSGGDELADGGGYAGEVSRGVEAAVGE